MGYKILNILCAYGMFVAALQVFQESHRPYIPAGFLLSGISFAAANIRKE